MTSVIIQPADIWTAAGVLLGFQVTSFIWRIDREVKMKDTGRVSHVFLTPSDFVNILSMIVIVVGVFILPILGLANPTILKDAFGLAALLFIGHAFARAGHYGLYSNALFELRYKKSKGLVSEYFPPDEQVVVVIVTIVAIAYVIVAAIQR